MSTFCLILFLFAIAAGLRGKPLPNVGFAFRGYHLLTGNPLATQVTSDPGFAGQIFQSDYSNNELSADQQYSVPAGVKVFNKDGCSQAFSSDVIETSGEYINLLKNIVKTNYTGFDKSFKGSADYQHIHKKTTKDSGSKFVMTQMLCVSYEAVLDSFNPPLITKDFRDGAMQIIAIPKDTPIAEINLRVHKFLAAFGTHFIKKLDMGSRYTYQHHLTTEMRQALLENDIIPSSGAVLSVSKKLGHTLTEEELIKSNLFDKISSKGLTSSSYAGGGTGDSVELAKKNPIPLFYEIERIDSLFVKTYMKKANLHYKLIKSRLGEYFNDYCGNEKTITGTDPCIVAGEAEETKRTPSADNFKIILPPPQDDKSANYLTWKTKLQKPFKAVSVSWWMKTPPYVSELDDDPRRTVLSYSNVGKLNLFKIEVNPETAGGCIGVWLNEKRITKDCHTCPIPVDDRFHHYLFTWSNVYGRWQVYIDGNVIEGGTDSRNYKIPQGGYIVIGQNQMSKPAGSSFQGEIAYLNLWDIPINGVETRLLSTKTYLKGNVIAWSQSGWKCTGDDYDMEIVLNNDDFFRI